MEVVVVVAVVGAVVVLVVVMVEVVSTYGVVVVGLVCVVDEIDSVARFVAIVEAESSTIDSSVTTSRTDSFSVVVVASSTSELKNL